MKAQKQLATCPGHTAGPLESSMCPRLPVSLLTVPVTDPPGTIPGHESPGWAIFVTFTRQKVTMSRDE